jgi:hypothetical protein
VWFANFWPAPKSGARADVGDVLLDEFRAVLLRRRIIRDPARAWPSLAPRRPTPSPVRPKIKRYFRYCHKLGDVSALCLSGGGIRSAAFALGVIQGLAKKGVLKQFDYLSTVSGGGYAGSFLTAWIQREGYAAVEEELKHTAPAEESPSPLQHLRRYSTYLAPLKGPFTADTLTLVALYVRNLLLNWLLIIPLAALVILSVKIFAVFVWLLPKDADWIATVGILAIAAIGLATLDSLRQRPGWESVRSNSRKFQLNEMLPTLVGGVLASIAAEKYFERPSNIDPMIVVAGISVIGAWISVISWMIAYFISRPPQQSRTSTQNTVHSRPRWAAATLASFAASGAVIGALLGYSFYLIGQLDSINARAFCFLSFGPPLLVAAHFAGELLHLAATSYSPWGDAEREWLARAAGYHARACITWMIMALVVFGGSLLVFELYREGAGMLSSLASVGTAAGVASAVLGRTSATAATIKERYNTWKNWSATLVLSIVTPIFLLITASFLSAAIDILVAGRPLSFWIVTSAGKEERWLWLGGIFATLAILSLAASFAINTNRFSLHGVYRNRLIRAFLGASNRTPAKQRQRSRFTDFNDRDNLHFPEIWPNVRAIGKEPPHFHVLNCALNIVATKELAWQERKALSFTATPNWIGSADIGRRGKGAFRLSSEYGRGDAAGMSLGTAMTISGAAASPNMGYHSSPALSVLLTFFNVRLGAWLGNPGRWGEKTYRRRGPLFAAKPLVQEALGLTTDDKKYVYLSDGGHFENLGLYEMIRRRCHLIVVSDAGFDPTVTFEDLGNAVRRISIDFNVRINFKSLTMGPRKTPPVKGEYFAAGEIVYPEPGAAKGLLLYIKPGFQGAEPVPVRSYAAANPAFPHEPTSDQWFGESFPHEPTSDQWFGESQFEAYRALGEYIVFNLDGSPRSSYQNIREFVEAAASQLAIAP